MGSERDFCNHLPPDDVRGHYRAVSNGIGLHEVIREISSMQASGDRRPGKTAAVSGLLTARPTYIGGLLEMANTQLCPFWASLTEGPPPCPRGKAVRSLKLKQLPWRQVLP
ncbi:MAG: hypothetical protein ACREYE_00155 [Gammaproteobacteria bacterium]